MFSEVLLGTSRELLRALGCSLESLGGSLGLPGCSLDLGVPISCMLVLEFFSKKKQNKSKKFKKYQKPKTCCCNFCMEFNCQNLVRFSLRLERLQDYFLLKLDSVEGTN